VVEGRDEHGRFGPGNPGGPGASPGRKQRKRYIGERFRGICETTDFEKVCAELLKHKNPMVKLDTMKFILDQGYGRPGVREDNSLFDDDRGLPDVFDAWELPANGEAQAASVQASDDPPENNQ
jgi:hypothetical protein